jgi:hypothetical protein
MALGPALRADADPLLTAATVSFTAPKRVDPNPRFTMQNTNSFGVGLPGGQPAFTVRIFESAMCIDTPMLLNRQRMSRVSQEEIWPGGRPSEPNVYLDTHRSGDKRHIVREDGRKQWFTYLRGVVPQPINASKCRLVYLGP